MAPIRQTFSGADASVQGGGDDDELLGSGAAFWFAGGGGQDRLTVNGGTATLLGEAGDDWLTYTEGPAGWLEGGAGNDVLYARHALATLYGGAGYDAFYLANGSFTVFGGDDPDYISADYTASRIDAGAGDDIIVSSNGNATIFGGEGDDRISLWASEALVDAGMGADVIVSAGGNGSLMGGAGNDDIRVLDGICVLSGGAGNDVLTVETGNSTLLGGEGADLLRAGAQDNILSGDRPVAASSNADAVRRLYMATFNRAPDDAGWAWWTDKLDKGMSLREVALAFAGSAEFQQRYAQLSPRGVIEALYANVLHRTAAVAEVDGWVQVLATSSLADVLLGFTQAAEMVARTDIAQQHAQIYRLYRAAFNRQPDIAGFESWTDRLGGNTRLADVAQGFASSAEFAARFAARSDAEFITAMYANVLGRQPDAAGMQSWLAAMAGGMSRAQVLRGFSESHEFTIATNADLIGFMRTRMTDWADTLAGGGGNDSLSGGRGADTFVFNAGETGTDQILDYEAWDILQFRGFGDRAAIYNHLTQSGADVVFANQGEVLFIRNTTIDMLTVQAI